MSRRIDKEGEEYTHVCDAKFGHEKEGSPAIWDNLDGLRGHSAK